MGIIKTGSNKVLTEGIPTARVGDGVLVKASEIASAAKSKLKIPSIPKNTSAGIELPESPAGVGGSYSPELDYEGNLREGVPGSVLITLDSDADAKVGNLQDYVNLFTSAGLISGGELTANGSSVTVAEGNALFRVADDRVSALRFFSFDEATFEIPDDGTTSYIGLLYNDGNPILELRSVEDYDLTTEIALGSASIVDDNLLVIENPHQTSDAIKSVIQRLDAHNYVQRDGVVGGLMIEAGPSRSILMSAGRVWTRLTSRDVESKDSAVDGITAVYYDGNELVYDERTDWENDKYWDADELVTLPVDEYACIWVYLSAYDGSLFYAYGTAAHADVGDANVEQPPSYLTADFNKKMRLLGRIVFVSGASTPESISSAFSVTFPTKGGGGGGGGGTVTSVAVANNTGITWGGSPITSAGTLTPTLSANLVAWHALATSAKQDALASSTSVILSGNQLQRAALTGDVTAAQNNNATTIAAGVVTLAKMANVATARFIGRITAGTGVPEALTSAQATSMLDNFTTTLKGLAPASGGGTTNFLRADGTWAAPSGIGTVTSVNLANSTGLTASGGPITGSGSLTYTLSANLQAWHALATSAKQDALGYTPSRVASGVNSLFSEDTRAAADAPSHFGARGLYQDFKQTAESGAPGNSFAMVQTQSIWDDDSGGGVHQLVFSDNGNLYRRYGTRAGGWGTMRTVWDSGTFDPATKQNSAYNSSANRFSFNTGVPASGVVGDATGGQGAIEILGPNSSSAAYIAFHRPSAFAGYFGLDTDNFWKVGGWSYGASSYKIFHEGNSDMANQGAGSISWRTSTDSRLLIRNNSGFTYIDTVNNNNSSFVSMGMRATAYSIEGGPVTLTHSLISSNYVHSRRDIPRLYIESPNQVHGYFIEANVSNAVYGNLRIRRRDNDAVIFDMDNAGNMTIRDITASRAGPTGVIWFGNGGNRYLFYNGTNYELNGAQLTINGQTAWNAGNDGAGSGLDADLIDGIQLDRIVHGSTANRTLNYENLNDSAIPSGFFESTPSGSNGPVGATWHWYMNVRHSNVGNHYGWQMAAPIGENRFFLRSINNGTPLAWGEIALLNKVNTFTATQIIGGVSLESNSGLYFNGLVRLRGVDDVQLTANAAAWVRIPRNFVQSGDPGAQAADGDLWSW